MQGNDSPSDLNRISEVVEVPVVNESGASAQNSNLTNGEAFNSFEEFQKRLDEFQDASYSAFFRRDAVTIAQCRKRGVKKHIAERLKYYMISYRCMHGGRNFKTKSTGQRSSSDFQKDCQASFRLTVQKGGNSLVLSDVNLDHNHQCTEKLYRHLPRARRLKPDEKTKIANLMNLDGNRKKIKHQILTATNKILLFKDLSNISAPSGNKNNLATTVKMLEEDYGAECHIYEENNIFKGLFFATPSMKSSMKSFPEFIGIDATFKLLNIRAPVYLVIVEDSEGCTKIVAGCILITEDKPSMSWFIECFKTAHPSWKLIKCVMADKDLLERDIIKTMFPSATVLICVFHTFRTFNREITCDKLGITPGQRDAAKEILQKMV